MERFDIALPVHGADREAFRRWRVGKGLGQIALQLQIPARRLAWHQEPVFDLVRLARLERALPLLTPTLPIFRM